MIFDTSRTTDAHQAGPQIGFDRTDSLFGRETFSH